LSGKDVEPAAQPAAIAAPEKGAAKTPAEQDLEFRKRQSEAAEQKSKAEKDSAAAEEKRKNCERARGQLAALESGQRVSRPNAKGEREFLDDAQRAEEIANSRKAVESLCK
jgi:hypothetical protein